LQALVPYVLLSILAGAIIFPGARQHRSLWRYTSLNDILRLIAAATIVVLVALSASFYLTRMENIARSLPVIQWLLLISSMAGIRVAVRLFYERGAPKDAQSNEVSAGPEQVLIVGVSDVTELYLRSAHEFAQGYVNVVGILAREPKLQGRSLRTYKVLGTPEDVQQVLSELDLHGVTVGRIAVMQPFERLSRNEQKALLAAERSTAVKVDWLVEKLGLRGGDASAPSIPEAFDEGEKRPPSVLQESERLPSGRYHYVKRAIDIAAAICVTIALAPILVFVAVLVALDVGFPLVFWQRRPGRYGRHFNMFKFRTMRAAHDTDGNRIPDQLRLSRIGDFLRRSRLDELPQLYNIVMGEMSFVGPRPLLPVDQPQWRNSRLLVRPGLTGWAQVNGGRDVPPEDKAALDVWYIMKASIWLDTLILLRTLNMLVFGERTNPSAIQAAHVMMEKVYARWGAKKVLPLSSDTAIMSIRAAPEAP
jgi:lipopolysaccharide/colanic/teichoic acid biosynthesis glycosyltransferase